MNYTPPMLIKLTGVLVMLLLLTSCGDSTVVDDGYDPARDYFTFANTGQFTTRHLELDLTVDFSRRVLRGHVIHHLERLDPVASRIVLDSRGLRVMSIQNLAENGSATELSYRVGPTDPVRGAAIEVDLPQVDSSTAGVRLKIDYETGPGASALMWLGPELTAGGEHPFLFSQSQSIHARSWIPLQDTPSVRFTYEAIIRTPAELLALMSADNDPAAERSGVHRFSMPQPIPSYLMALAVGNVYFAPFGGETGVYAEPEVLEAAAWEFADTQAMLETAEAIYGPYRWGRYDLLILPPSFPYGGMENPRLSFITPSILAGDRSLVSMIAHELAHSWSGNLVSNRTWRDIWLNEGTTSYLEARLMEHLYSKERADEERVLMYRQLLEVMPRVPAAMQPLAPVFRTGDPDTGQLGMEYAKGQLLLEHLESVFGREIFDRFLAGYFDSFAFQSISSEQFLEHVDKHLLKEHPGLFSLSELEEWLYQPGLPDRFTRPTSASLEEAGRQAVSWSLGELATHKLEAEHWSPQATVQFIQSLADELEPDRLVELDENLGLSRSGNAEITRSWFIEVAKRRHLPAYPSMQSYLARYGRTRLIRPVYSALVGNGQDRARAKSLFEENQAAYHPLTVAAIEPLFDTPED